jgi:hypothetical protein
MTCKCAEIEAENKALRDALGDAIDYVSGNLDISIRGDDLKETWQALKGGGDSKKEIEMENGETDMRDSTRFATATFEILAEQIMNMIMDGLITSECVEDKDHGVMSIWSANSQEQIATHIQRVIQPE